MLSTRTPSVKDTYFQHKLLTKIHGKPTYPTLQVLHTELKANAGSVPTTLFLDCSGSVLTLSG